MLFAQISNGVIMNVIELDDPTLIPIFLEGYDSCVQIDILPTLPQIGWNYNTALGSFNPVKVAGGNDSDIQYNNSGTIEGTDNFTFDGNNVTVSAGVVNAQEFIYSRQITQDITVPNGCSMINSNMQLNSTLTLLGDAELILL